MSVTQRMVRLIKTVSELGFKKSAYFGTYLLARKSGFYSNRNRISPFPNEDFQEPEWIRSFFNTKVKLQQTISQSEKAGIIASADGIVDGQMMAFGIIPQPISFDDQRNEIHWSKISDAFADGDDIKLHWESARFAWAFPLIQAYHLNKDQKYYESFKRYVLDFEVKTLMHRVFSGCQHRK